MSTPDKPPTDSANNEDRDAKYLAGFETARHKTKRIALGILFALVALFAAREFFAGPAFVANYTNGVPQESPTAQTSTVGMAKVTQCAYTDWLRTLLVGGAWDCHVHVNWNAGTPANGDYFVPLWSTKEDDTGKKLSVVKTGSGSRYSHDITAAKNEHHPYSGWYVPIIIICVLFFIFFGALALLRLVPYSLSLSVSTSDRAKLREGLKQEGKIPNWYEPGTKPPPPVIK